MTGCEVYKISGNTGIYVEFSDKILPYYQTTIIEGNITTDYRNLATISITDE